MSSLTPEGLGVDLEGLRLRGQDNDAQRSQDLQTIEHFSAESEYVPAREFYREMAVATAIVTATVFAAFVAIFIAISAPNVIQCVFAVVALVGATVALALDSLFTTLYTRALLRSRRDI